jgi:hypothetical protein
MSINDVDVMISIISFFASSIVVFLLIVLYNLSGKE